MSKNLFSSIFRKSSSTYYFASLFFPKEVREDVFILYAFVRTADNFVDELPQNVSGFERFVQETEQGFKYQKSIDPIVNAFVKMAERRHVQEKWVQDFFSAMRSDITTRTYHSYRDLEQYMYGSAEVVGLMMARILDVSKEGSRYAQTMGKAMQLINFIRDIQEDLRLGRVYIPEIDQKKYKVKYIPPHSKKEHGSFIRLIRYEILKYRELQLQVKKGFQYIPKQYRKPIMLASALYDWTAKEIYKNPMVVFEKKVKPSFFRVLFLFLFLR